MRTSSTASSCSPSSSPIRESWSGDGAHRSNQTAFAGSATWSETSSIGKPSFSRTPFR
ncbi:hypothetical protein [Nonomuraea rubra]|uniref:hypothetical protein n=1 Tax=Nonomuraea rubra TaxID=46180 RepID=UPI0031EF9594